MNKFHSAPFAPNSTCFQRSLNYTATDDDGSQSLAGRAVIFVCFSETHEVISDLECKICAENGHRRNFMFCIRAQTLLLDSRTIVTHMLTISRPDRLYWLHSWRFSDIMGSKWYFLRSTPWTKFHSTPCAPNSTCFQCSLNYRSNRRWWIAGLSRSCRDFSSAPLKLMK